MTTAQDEYKKLLKDFIGPQLRALGYQGSGNSWRYIDSTSGNLIIFTFQKDKHSTSKEVSFTLNLAVYNADFWNWIQQTFPNPDYSPTRYPSLGYEYYGVIGGRNGSMIPGPNRWWRLVPGDDLEQLAADVVGSIREHIHPVLHKLLPTQAQIDFLVEELKQSPNNMQLSKAIMLSVIMPPDHPYRSQLQQLLLDRARDEPRPPWLPEHAKAFAAREAWPLKEYRSIWQETLSRIKDSTELS